MVTTTKTERDRGATESRLLETFGLLIRDVGFEKAGINLIADRAGVSKILIYRYFGSLDGLRAAYVRQHDFWINYPHEIPACREELPGWLKRMFRDRIAQLRADAALRRLCRWELSSDNELIVRLREQRERIGMEQIGRICVLTGYSEERIAPLAALATASVTYLAMLGEFCPVYNGIALNEDAGWERIAQGIESLVDSIFRE